MGSAPRSATRLGSARRLPIRPMVVPRAPRIDSCGASVARSRGACRRRRASDQGSLANRRTDSANHPLDSAPAVRRDGVRDIDENRVSHHLEGGRRGRASRDGTPESRAQLPGDLLRTVHPEPAGNRPDVFLAGVRAVDRHEREPSLGRSGASERRRAFQGRHRIVDPPAGLVGDRDRAPLAGREDRAANAALSSPELGVG